MVSAMDIFCKWLFPSNHRSSSWAIATHSICTILWLRSTFLDINLFCYYTNKDKMFLSITCPVVQPLIWRESKNVSCIRGRSFWKVTKRKYTANFFCMKIGVCLCQKLGYNILIYPPLFSSLWTSLGKLFYHYGF